MNPTSAKIRRKKERIRRHRDRNLTYRHCGRIEAKPFKCSCGKDAIAVYCPGNLKPRMTDCMKPLHLGE